MVAPASHAGVTDDVRRLIWIATWLCGDAAGRQVFEPLIADWDRELRHSPTLSARAAVVVRGLLAFTLTLVICGTRHALTEGTGMWKYAAATFVAAAAISIALEAMMIDLSVSTDYPPDLLLIAALRFSQATALATAMLPALFLLRRDSGAGTRTAMLSIGLGAVVVAAGVAGHGWIENYQPTFNQNERMFQRLRANDRAGRVQYPGTAYRDLREATSSVEERRARYEQFQTLRAEQLAKAPPPPTPWRRISRSNTTVLAVLFGAIGWLLGGVVRPTFERAVMWWAAAWLLTLAADGRLTNLLDLPHYRFSWWTLPAFAAATALALMVADRRGELDRRV